MNKQQLIDYTIMRLQEEVHQKAKVMVRHQAHYAEMISDRFAHNHFSNKNFEEGLFIATPKLRHLPNLTMINGYLRTYGLEVEDSNVDRFLIFSRIVFKVHYVPRR